MSYPPSGYIIFSLIDLKFYGGQKLGAGGRGRITKTPFFDKETIKNNYDKNFLQNKTEENGELYAKQRKFCVSLFGKIKKRYYENLIEKSAIDNKLFWKSLKPFLSFRTKFI